MKVLWRKWSEEKLRELYLIISAYKEKGYFITEEQAEDIWDILSNEYDAQWLGVTTNLEYIFSQTIHIVEREYMIIERERL